MAYLRAYQARATMAGGMSPFRGGRRAVPMGDPFLGGLIGIGAKLIGRLAPKILPGVGRIGGAIGRVIGRGRGVIRGPVGSAVIGGAAAGTAGGLISGRAARGGAGGGGSFGGGYRRMNVGNIKALRRSIRRVQGFSKLAKQTIHMERAVRLKHKRRK